MEPWDSCSVRHPPTADLSSSPRTMFYKETPDSSRLSSDLICVSTNMTKCKETEGWDTSPLDAPHREQVAPVGGPCQKTMEEDVSLALTEFTTLHISQSTTLSATPAHVLLTAHVCDWNSPTRITAEKTISSGCNRPHKVWDIFTSTTVFKW